MSSSKPTLAEQVKEAERDKLFAEKEKLEYDLQQSKKFFTKNTFWTIVVTVAVFGFYYDFAAKPIIERDTILGSLENAKTKLELDKKSEIIAKEAANNNILRGSLIQEHLKAIKTADTLNLARIEINNARNAITKFTTILKSNPTKVDLIKAQSKVTTALNEVSKYKIRIDSLKKFDFNNYVIVIIHFVYKDNQFPPPVSGAYLKLEVNPMQSMLFPPFRINGGYDGTYYIFSSKMYYIILDSKEYKLKDEYFHFVSPAKKADFTVINVPIVDR